MGTDDFQDPVAALAELRARLKAGLASHRVTQTQLARRAGLGRTTVSQALSDSAPPPSTQTVGALAEALSLEIRPLLDLLSLVSGPAQTPESAVGQLIGDANPLDLEVHPAAGAPAQVRGSGRSTPAGLPGYVCRPHDAELADIVTDAVQGNSRMAVLVGSSSTGKTRACWEAIQPLASRGWTLWHPFDPTRAEAALTDLARVGPRTVVWLNEAQHYLGADGGMGERIAAAVHALLTDAERRPVLVLATLWPAYANRYTTLSSPWQDDAHPQVRELLAGRLITLPDSFDEDAIQAAEALAAAGDQQLAHALEHSPDGRLTQYLAGAPQLLHRYETASPPARALLEAAMDARRLGADLYLPLAFLEHAAVDYLTDDEYDTLADSWFEQALAETNVPVHGNLAPLRSIRPRTSHRAPVVSAPTVPACRLADYLEQHGRHVRRWLCPPESFWQAAYQHLANPEDLTRLGTAASHRHRLRWAHRLWHKAADANDVTALMWLSALREEAGEMEGAERLAQQAAKAGNWLPLFSLSRKLLENGHQDEAERLARQAAKVGDWSSLAWIALKLEQRADRLGADRIAQEAYEAGDRYALKRHALLRENKVRDSESVIQISLKAQGAGDPFAVGMLCALQDTSGIQIAFQELALRAADADDSESRPVLARLRSAAWNRGGVRFPSPADAEDAENLSALSWSREKGGDREGAERLARQAANAGDPAALVWLALRREKSGDRKVAEQLARQATDAQAAGAFALLAVLQEKSGDRERAEQLARQAADAGHDDAVERLALARQRAGKDKDRLWLHGLEPDGTTSTPWSPSAPPA